MLYYILGTSVVSAAAYFLYVCMQRPTEDEIAQEVVDKFIADMMKQNVNRKN